MPKKIRQDLFPQFIHAAELVVYVGCYSGVFGYGVELGKTVADGEEDAVDLGVFVDEHEGVGDVLGV